MKQDEREFMEALRSRHAMRPTVRQVAAELGIPRKRAAYICDKWTRKGWYDYGVSVLAGWLTDEGQAVDLT
jgi:hypothetical protein